MQKSRIVQVFTRLGGALAIGAGAMAASGCGGEAGIGSGTGGSGGEAGSNDAGGGGVIPGGGSGGTSAGGEGPGGEGPGGEGFGGSPDFSGDPLTRAAKLDLLLVVDNSITIQQKQSVFAEALPAFLARLVNPHCVGGGDDVEVAGPDAPCPAGSEREFTPLADIHVGVISTSLGAHGGDVCSEALPGNDDKARLIPLVRDGSPPSSGAGFAKWDRDGAATPPGVAVVDDFVTEVVETVNRVGATGCGYENQLESWYRFLVDPEPPLEVPFMGSAQGVDEDVLAQRAAFLRPDSAVAIVLLTDENDCSVMDEGQGYLVGLQQIGNSRYLLPPATSACAADPNDICCRSCAAEESARPAGCLPAADDAACQRTAYTELEDNANLRCWDQKRRFGMDLLYPVSRYTEALRSPTVRGRDGRRHPNPLFAEHEGRSRRPSIITFGAILGVPWQDVADEASLEGDGLELLRANELVSQDRWPLMTRSSGMDQPDDPFMVETFLVREGTHPLTDDEILAPGDGRNAINGHESRIEDAHVLQPACSFPLRTPVSCADETSCICDAASAQYRHAACEPADGGTPEFGFQYSAVAYPSLRQLDVLRSIGSSAVVGSVCPKVIDPSERDYGYNPVFRAVGDRLRDTLE